MTGEGEALTPEQIDRLAKQLTRANRLLMVARATIAEAEEFETARSARQEADRRARRRERRMQAVLLGVGTLLILGAAVINLGLTYGWLAP